ncbi:galanin receptor 2b-like [Saccoglossus kowalevskii]|uniref:Allatostatin-A receptor-like n=1 Tax=Saccoglossus kowalevskii TaxID=10224 RepID=A0ABM0MNN9_SACKO|nr:PREDICTED: allatostatin-A receptor-like [Saccoglossus kowalevskii]
MEFENRSNSTSIAENVPFRYPEYLQLIVGIIGVIGNALVFILVAKVKFLQTTPNLFVASLAMTDLLASLLILAKLVYMTYPVPDYFHMTLYCKVVLSDVFFWMTAISSVFILIGVTIDRFCAIVYPFRYQASFTNAKAYILIVLAWMLAIVFVLFIPFVYEYQNGKCLQDFNNRTHQVVTGIGFFLFTYIFPMIFMVFAYTKMFKVICNASSDVQSQSSAISSRVRILKMLTTVVVVFFICWSPNQWMYFLLSTFEVRVDFYSTYYETTVLMCLGNSCINPFIYALKSRQFYEGFRTLVGCTNTIDHVDGI